MNVMQEPKSTGLTRVDTDTIAVSYVVGGTSSTVTTYHVDTGSAPHFTDPHSVNFRDGTNGDQTHHHSLITFDENRLVIAYSHPDSGHGGFIQVITINPADGNLSAGLPVTTTSDQGLYHSVVKLDDDTVVVTYRGTVARGFIQTFDISFDSTITPGTPVQHESARTAYYSLVLVDSNTVAVAYSVLGVGSSMSDGYGRIKVFDVDSNNDITGRGGPIYYNAVTNTALEEQAHFNSLALLDSDTLALAYRGADADGFIRLYDINHNTGSLNATGGPFEHDPADGAFNSLVRVDDGTLALVYGGDLLASMQDSPATPNRIKALAVVVPDTTPPVIESAILTDVNTIVLTASQSLDESATATGFTVSGNPVTVDPEILGSTITIKVDMAIPSGDMVTMGYGGYRRHN